MSEQPLRELMRGLRKAADPAEVGGLTDTDLLRRWVAHRDAAAFEVLLWRHGPAILGLCRRLLRDGHAAEDAFQAAFLALALKAASISRGEAIASWLYKVAYRAALRLRAGTRHWQAPRPGSGGPRGNRPDRSRRPARSSRCPRRGTGSAAARYRYPLVLCYFEGRTNEEAAREWAVRWARWSRGWPVDGSGCAADCCGAAWPRRWLCSRARCRARRWPCRQPWWPRRRAPFCRPRVAPRR